MRKKNSPMSRPGIMRPWTGALLIALSGMAGAQTPWIVDTHEAHQAYAGTTRFFSAFTYDAAGHYSTYSIGAAGTTTPFIVQCFVLTNHLCLGLLNLAPGETNALETGTNLWMGDWTICTQFVPRQITNQMRLPLTGDGPGVFFRLREVPSP